MTGNVPITPQVLGASTVAGVAAASLPETGVSVFSVVLFSVAAVATAVIISRVVKILASR